MRVVDLQRLDLPDAEFDWVVCSHVLEHIHDDRAAMREMHRVLRSGGSLVLQVPMFGEHTVEDPTITDPAERLARFGQQDHVRMYGRDVLDRLRAAGFDVDRRVYRKQLTARERERYGLNYTGVPDGFAEADDVWTVILCRRPPIEQLYSI
jgi:SAM-dependent methyltransferase